MTRAKLLFIASSCSSLIAAGVLACGSSSSGNSGPPLQLDASSTADGTSGQGDGSAASDGGNGDTIPDSGKTGEITLSQAYVAATKGYSHTSSAFFSATPPPSFGTAPVCNTTTEGACKVTICEPVTLDAGTDAGVDAGEPDSGVDAGIVAAPNAGEITLSGPSFKTSIDLFPDSVTGLYASKTAATQVFVGADAVRFKAVGADAKAIDTTLPAPALLVVTAPLPPDGGTLYSWSRAKDLDVTFTGGDATTNASVLLFGTDDKKDTVTAQCAGPSMGGSLTVTATTLAHFATKGAGAISIATQATKVVGAGDYAVTLTLNASSASGGFISTD